MADYTVPMEQIYSILVEAVIQFPRITSNVVIVNFTVMYKRTKNA